MARTQWASVVHLTSVILLSTLVIESWASGCRKADTPNELYEQIVRTVDHGDLNASLANVEKALNQNVGNSIEWHWRFLVLKARILISRSSFQDALNLLHDELPAQLAASDVAVRKKLMEGIAHRYGQEFEKSARDLEDALALARSSQPRLVCEAVKAIGELQVDEKKYSEADASFREALQLARKENRQDQIAGALVDLARLATSEEHFGDAIDRNQRALDLSRSLDMQGLVATILGNTAWSYYELGDFEKALASFKEAARVSEHIGQTGYSFYWLTGVANSYLALNDPSSAQSIFTDTLKRARQLGDAATITICLDSLAEISLKVGRLNEAADYNREALKVEEAGLDHFGTLQSWLVAGRIETSRQHFAQGEKLFQRVLQDRQADTPSRWEAQARLAKLHDAQGLTQKAEKEYHESIDTIEVARSLITQEELRVSFLSRGIEFYDDYIGFLIAHGRQTDALEVGELSRARTLEDGLRGSARLTKSSSKNTQPQLSARRLGATLLFYWLGEKHSYLWVITPVKTTCLTLPAASEINSDAKSYQNEVAASDDVAETHRLAGEKLYATLVAPAQKLIPPNSRVILLPDASLYSLNFETLIVPAPKPHFWIEDVTVTTASSLTLLASAAARPAPKEKSLFLVGNTISPSADFPALPQAAAEMQHVEQYFPPPHREILSGSEATPAAYLSSEPENFSYLHFVTHGTASRARPLESAVILSKGKDEDTYKLYARDIVKRRLSAYLVTISACNGAGTRAYSGEGLVGLSWAFLRAGAHNVIGALWEVSDASTPQLMDKLYDGLSHGEDPASALRAAKLSLLHSDGVFRKPYYWAPFQLYAGS